MPDDLFPTWPRPHLPDSAGAAGAGFEPLVLYRVYGDLDLSSRPLTAEYRCAGVPKDVRVMQVDRAEDPKPFDEAVEGTLGAIMRGTLPDLDDRVRAARHCCLVAGWVKEHRTLDYFRDVVGLIAWLLDCGGTFVYDPQQFRCWTPAEWRRFAFEPGEPEPLTHVLVLFSEEANAPGRWWYHTRGMRKFGRPDVSVHGVPESHRDDVIALCRRLIVHQADGAVIPDGYSIRVEGLPDGAIVTNRGDFEDADFNNVHLDISFPGWG